MMPAALFVRRVSVYRDLGCEVFDEGRDARTFALDRPVIAHPLAWWAVHVVRHCGGVLEHPLRCRLWGEIGCGTPGVRDQHGGVLLTVLQGWFGKATGLYVVGPVPSLPDELADLSSTTVQRMCRAERERTPVQFAEWLVACARRCAA